MISSSSSVISCLFSDSVLRLGVDFRRIPVKVEAVSRIVDDSGAVLLRKDTFAHDPVTVCGARLQALTTSSATIGIWKVSAITASRDIWPEGSWRAKASIPVARVLSREKLRSTFRAIPFMRNRFTGIDLIYRAGLMEEVENYLFGKPWK